MNIRVTTQTQTANAIADIQRQNSTLAKYQSQISSGLRVNLPSDDPTAFPALAVAKAASQRYAAYAQTISDSTTTLNQGVSALGNMSDILTQAKQIAIEGADGGTDATGSAALATQVDGLISQALSTANTQTNGLYSFSGTATNTQPFQVTATDANGNPTTIAYTGATQRERSLIGSGQTIDTRYAGDQVFQQAGGDVFQTLIGLRDDLRNAALTGPAKSAALNLRLGQVDAASAAIGDATAEQASGLVTLQSIQSRVSDLKLGADTRVGELGSTDYADAVVKMKEQETGLQATLAVSARLLQPTLLDFIH